LRKINKKFDFIILLWYNSIIIKIEKEIKNQQPTKRQNFLRSPRRYHGGLTYETDEPSGQCIGLNGKSNLDLGESGLYRPLGC